MPYTLKSNRAKFKDANGNYKEFDVISENSTASQIAAIEAKGVETLASIPADYTTLSDDVSDLKSAIKNNNSYDALEFMNASSAVDKGITYTCNSDGSIHVSGTETGGGDAWFRYCYGALPEWLVQGRKYVMQLDASTENINLRLYWYNNASFETRIGLDAVYGTEEKEVTVPANCGGLIAILAVQNGASVNETVHPKVLYGKTNAELTDLTLSIFEQGYRALDVDIDGYVKEDTSGRYIDANDLVQPGTYIIDTSIRKVNAPNNVINCIKTEKYGKSNVFIKQTAFDILTTDDHVTTLAIDKSQYVRYCIASGFTPWVKYVEIKKQDGMYHSAINFNAYDILFPMLYANESAINGITYTFSADGSVHVQGTTTSSSYYEIFRGALPDMFIAGKTYYVKMDSSSGLVTLRLYFYDDTWSDNIRVAYFISNDQEISIPSFATNAIIWFGIGEPGEHVTVNETCHPAVLTRQPAAPTINNNTFNYTVHSDTYNVSANPVIQSSTDLYLASTGTTADRTTDIMTLLQTKKVCKLGVGDFYIRTGVDMPDGTSIIGCGRGTRVILDTSVTEGYTISVGSYCSVQDLHLMGMPSGSLPYEEYTPGGRDGIVLLGDATGFDGGTTFAHNFAKLSNLWIDDFNGSGVKAYRNDGAASFLAENIDILRCGVGVNIALFSEFHSWENIRTRWCVYACIMNGGNNLFSNCHFDVNMHGLLIDNSLGNLVNDTHSSFTNCTWCHIANNTGNAIEVINTQNGLAFSNCQIFFSKIILTDTKGVTIQGFNIGANEEIIITRCNGINISNCIFGGAPSIHLDSVTGLIFENNMTKEGVLLTAS